MSRAPARRRADGSRTPPDRLRRPGTRVLGALVSASALLVLGLWLLLGPGRSGDAQTAAREAGVVADVGGLDLPLDLASVGFVPDGTVESTTSSKDGPGAVRFCNRRPDAEGLLAWNANQLTEGGERRRVAQIVARFGTSVEAGVFVQSSADTASCGAWRTTDQQRTFTVAETVAPTIYGDDTRIFELQMDYPDGPTLFLRTALVRYRTDVLQLTFVSANRQDLGELDDLTELAVQQLGFEP